MQSINNSIDLMRDSFSDRFCDDLTEVILSFLPIEEKDWETKKTYYAACDLAITEKKRSAYSAIVVGGVDSAGYLHIVDVRRGRWDSLQIADEIFSVASRHNIEIFKIESENINQPKNKSHQKSNTLKYSWRNLSVPLGSKFLFLLPLKFKI